MRWLWAPRSVGQIVIVAMTAVLAPLALLLYHTTTVLQNLAFQSQQVNENAIRITRATRALSTGLTDLERLARQYQVLGEISQRELFETRMQQIELPLRQVAVFVTDGELATRAERIDRILLEMRDMLETSSPQSNRLQRLVAQLAPLHEDLSALTAGARNELRNDMRTQSAATIEARETIINTAILLIPLTLMMMVGFTILIVKPVGHLRSAIRRLGNEDPGAAYPIRLTGPAELMSLGRQLEWLRLRLSETKEEKDIFLRHVSHELKTPLSSIREGSALLREEIVGPLTRAQREVLALVEDNSRSLQHMIENLLQINRSHNPADRLLEIFDLNSLARELLRAHSLQLSSHHMYVCIGGPELKLMTDRAQLRTALDNLLSNAIAYGFEGGRIWMNWFLLEGQPIIQVANTGNRISESDQERIFEPFYQGHRKRQGAVKGSGVGLAVARQCAEALGGSLRLIPERADVCFELLLPAEAVPELA